jgi:hypothetical protein
MSDRHHRLARNRYLGDTTAAELLATLVLKGRLGLAPLLSAHALPGSINHYR